MLERYGMKRCALLLAISTALCACSLGSEVRGSFQQSVATGAAPLVRIRNTVGEVRVTGWEKHSVDVDAIKSAHTMDELIAIHIDIASQGNTVTIETKYRGPARGGVRYDISVPAGASVDIENATGAAHVDGVSGNVTAVTQTGEVRADLGRVTGTRSVDLTATTGSVRLTIDPDSDAKVDARTSVGSFESDFPSISEQRENVVGARASGTIGRGSATIRLTATTGSISLRR
jgi:hypothetical protein